jgi:hypothetical protein
LLYQDKTVTHTPLKDIFTPIWAGPLFGQLGGAFYGVDAIPAKWLAKLAMRELITEMVDSLLALSRDFRAY